MKRLELYYVFDAVGNCAITSVIPVSNALTAALGFRDSYIKNEKSPYNYKGLRLIHCGNLDVDENGNMFISEDQSRHDVIAGKDIMTFISAEMAALGIDDAFVEDEVE